MLTEPNFNQAAEAYETFVLESNEGVDCVGLISEAGNDVVRLDNAAAHLQLAIETYISNLKGWHIGKPTEDAEELARLIIDYMQDSVGHQASDVLRASLKVGEK